MADVQIKVDILPEITKAAIQEAVNAAASGLKLNIGSVQLGGVDTSQLTRDVQTLLQKAFQNPKSPPKITPKLDMSSQRNEMKQLTSMLGPLEARLRKLKSSGFDGWKVDKLSTGLRQVQANIKSLSGATSGEFRKMLSSIRSEMKEVDKSLTKSEREMQQRLMGNLKPVNSMYSTLYNKMGKSGMAARQAELESAYHAARQATEKSVSARMSGDTSAAALESQAKQAREAFLSLGREIENDFTEVNKLQKVLSTLENKRSILGKDSNLDSSKLSEMEAKIRELKSALEQMGSASSSEFGELKAQAQSAATAAGKIGDELSRESKDMTTDLRQVYSLLEKINKLERDSAGGTMDAGWSKRLNNLKQEAEGMLSAGVRSKERTKQLQNEAAALKMEGGFSGGSGGGSTSKIAALFKNVTGGMIAYEAFYKAKEAAHAMYESVVSVDDAMTQLKIVTGASGNEMKTFFQEASASATEFGHSVSEVLGSIETFSRLGYNLNDALNLSNAATVMSNVAAVGVDQSTTGLTSIIKGYGLGADQSMEVADKLTLVGKNWAVSAGELMEALERGGSSLASANNSLDESVALIAAGNASVQDAASVGEVCCRR